MCGGFYRIRVDGSVMQLFNGWNLTFPNGIWATKIRLGAKWNNSSLYKYFHYTRGNDMRSSHNSAWEGRFITILPGYKAKLYNPKGYQYIMYSNGEIFTEGDHYLNSYSKFVNGQSVHFIALALLSENLPGDYIDLDAAEATDKD